MSKSRKLESTIAHKQGQTRRISLDDLVTKDIETEGPTLTNENASYVPENMLLSPPPSEKSTRKDKVDSRSSLSSSPSIKRATGSFSLKRKYIPEPLDLDALRRERQFSGPYSMIPLLSPERTLTLTETTDVENSERKKPKESDYKRVGLPPIVPAPYSAHKLHQLLPESPLLNPTRDFDKPSNVNPGHNLMLRNPRSASRSRSHISGGVPSTCEALINSYSAYKQFDVSRSLYSAHSASAGNNELRQKLEKKASFINLCGNLWDIINE